MSYPLLDPSAPPAPDRNSLCAMAIMAKAPREGKVKTRLSPPFTLAETAALNICFLQDTAESIARTKGAAGLICYTPVGEEAAFEGLFPAEFCLVPQRGDGFGERLLAAAHDILRCGYSSVCLIDSDSPTVPAQVFQTAVDELAKPGDRVVLGPSNDGGYYLIGLKQAHPELFQSISWSTDAVARETRERGVAANLDLLELPFWYDVDDATSLAVLRAELLEGKRPAFASLDGSPAKATRSYLARYGADAPAVPIPAQRASQNSR